MTCRVCGAELIYAGSDTKNDEVIWVCPNDSDENHSLKARMAHKLKQTREQQCLKAIDALKRLQRAGTVLPKMAVIYTPYGKDGQWEGDFIEIGNDGNEHEYLTEEDDAWAICELANNAQELIALLEGWLHEKP